MWFLFGIAALMTSVMHLMLPVRVATMICFAVVFLVTELLYMALTGAAFATALGVIYNDQRKRLDKPAHVGE